jgi:hypothetical protein
MKTMKTGMIFALVAGLSAGVGITVASAQTPAAAPAAKSTAAGVAVTPAAIARVAAMVPPANATQSQTAGTGAVQVGTANNASDTDSSWNEGIDMDGDGNVEVTSLVWDDEDKVLFAYSAGTFTCRNGATGTGGLLIAVNGAVNPRRRPAGSGFWVAEIDANECGAQAAGIAGCRFDASGNPTACGIVTVDEANDDIVIVTAQN